MTTKKHMEETKTTAPNSQMKDTPKNNIYNQPSMMKETPKPQAKPQGTAEKICDKKDEKPIAKEHHHCDKKNEHKEHSQMNHQCNNCQNCQCGGMNAYSESFKFYDTMTSFLTEEVTKLSDNRMGFGTNLDQLNRLIDVQLRIDDAKKKIIKNYTQ